MYAFGKKTQHFSTLKDLLVLVVIASDFDCISSAYNHIPNGLDVIGLPNPDNILQKSYFVVLTLNKLVHTIQSNFNTIILYNFSKSTLLYSMLKTILQLSSL